MLLRGGHLSFLTFSIGTASLSKSYPTASIDCDMSQENPLCPPHSHLRVRPIWPPSCDDIKTRAPFSRAMAE